MIAVRGFSNRGKSQSIIKACELLMETDPEAKPTWIHPADGKLDDSVKDICVIVKTDGHYIGIESEGDPGFRQPESLKRFASGTPQCSVIVCATRTRGTTVAAVVNTGTHYGYPITWIRAKKYPPESQDARCAEIAKDIVARITTILVEKEVCP